MMNNDTLSNADSLTYRDLNDRTDVGYIKVEMLPTASGLGGSFTTEAAFLLDNFQAPFYDIGVKIDTGCSISTIPLKRLNVSETLCRTLKKEDIFNHIPYYLSYGVESGGIKHSVPATEIEKMNCPAMKFEHEIGNFTIGGMKIPCDRICLNYDRRGNILIGMDILAKLDIHMGISKVTGENLLIACPLESKSQEYLDALAEHFGIC